ncbi:MAG TPA: hypothetical protein VFE50_16515 [Cyclobacteriaceae bacterium]|nr:hypothetical protein [Cyclobacteriaceae bacterium]
MNKTIFIFVICGALFSCSVKDTETSTPTSAQNEQSTSAKADGNFNLIDDFEKSSGLFRRDTFELYDQSAEGGQLVALHSKDKDYLVFDIWLFGETGKIHSIYWTDKKLNFILVKRVDYTYDRPFYEDGYKTEEKTSFYSFLNNSFMAYDADRQEMKHSNTSDMENKLRSFFTDVAKGVEIGK